MRKVIQSSTILLALIVLSLTLAPSSHAVDSMMKEVTTHTGRKVMPVGNSSATLRWSVVNGAQAYNVYCREESSSTPTIGVRVPDKGTSISINYLNPNASYLCKVAAMVAGKEVWLPELVLQRATRNPVLSAVPQQVRGTRTPTSYAPTRPTNRVLGQINKALGTQTTCSNTGTVRVSISVPTGVNVAKIHILYGTTAGKYAHALRNLSPDAREVTIGALSTCMSYYYQVAIVASDGRVHWQGEKMMSPTSN